MRRIEKIRNARTIQYCFVNSKYNDPFSIENIAEIDLHNRFAPLCNSTISTQQLNTLKLKSISTCIVNVTRLFSKIKLSHLNCNQKISYAQRSKDAFYTPNLNQQNSNVINNLEDLNTRLKINYHICTFILDKSKNSNNHQASKVDEQYSLKEIRKLVEEKILKTEDIYKILVQRTAELKTETDQFNINKKKKEQELREIQEIFLRLSTEEKNILSNKTTKRSYTMSNTRKTTKNSTLPVNASARNNQPPDMSLTLNNTSSPIFNPHIGNNSSNSYIIATQNNTIKIINNKRDSTHIASPNKGGPSVRFAQPSKKMSYSQIVNSPVKHIPRKSSNSMLKSAIKNSTQPTIYETYQSQLPQITREVPQPVYSTTNHSIEHLLGLAKAPDRSLETQPLPHIDSPTIELNDSAHTTHSINESNGSFDGITIYSSDYATDETNLSYLQRNDKFNSLITNDSTQSFHSQDESVTHVSALNDISNKSNNLTNLSSIRNTPITDTSNLSRRERIQLMRGRNSSRNISTNFDCNASIEVPRANNSVHLPSYNNTTHHTKPDTQQEALKDDKKTYKIVITLNGRGAQITKNYNEIENEIRRHCKGLFAKHHAYLKENQIIITCYQEDYYNTLLSNWEGSDFQNSLLKVEPGTVEEKKIKNLIYARINFQIQNSDMSWLKSEYNIRYEDVKQVGNNVYTMVITDDTIYEEIIKRGYLQVASRAINIWEPKAREKPIRVVTCHYCLEFGHYQNFCPRMRNKDKAICQYCAKEHHSDECSMPKTPLNFKCAKCPAGANNHRATSNQCPKYQDEIYKIAALRNSKELTIQNKDRIHLENEKRIWEDQTRAEIKAYVDGEINKMVTYTRSLVFDDNINEVDCSIYEKDIFERPIIKVPNTRLAIHSLPHEQSHSKNRTLNSSKISHSVINNTSQIQHLPTLFMQQQPNGANTVEHVNNNLQS
jgi:hypothetical protein